MLTLFIYPKKKAVTIAWFPRSDFNLVVKTTTRTLSHNYTSMCIITPSWPPKAIVSLHAG